MVRMKTDRVLDASAVLAVLFGESGAEVAQSAGHRAVISAVNIAEVLAKLVRRGMPVEAAVDAIDNLDIETVSFGPSEAIQSARLATVKGLSLGDCACLATAAVRGWPVLTADRHWKEAVPGQQVIVIR